MSYRKFRADHLFTGHQLLGNDHVLITDKEGVIKGIEPLATAGEGIHYVKGILTPGFVNCHCHLELSHLKGIIPQKTGMIDFLLTVISQRNFSHDDILQAMKEAEQYMLDQGIVATGDICNTAYSFELKKGDAGAAAVGAYGVAGFFEAPDKRRRLHYHNFIECTGFIAATAAQRFEASRNTFEKFALLYQIPLTSNSIVPHAGYSVSPELFQLITGFPGNHLLTIHSQESESEDEFFRNGTGDLLRLYQTLGIDISFYSPSGKSSLQTYFPYFLPNQSIILVHNVTTSESDLEFLAALHTNNSKPQTS